MDFKRIKAILWDNDGVLVDTEPLYLKANQLAMRELGIDISEKDFAEYFLKSARGGLMYLTERGITPEEAKQALSRRFDIYMKFLKKGDYARDGVSGLLETVGGNRAMAIVTSSLPEHFQIIRDKYPFYKHFDFVLSREAYIHPKPHPECYQLALQKTGFAAEEVLVVEDSQRGLMAAHGAGLSCAVIPSGLTRGLDFSKANYVLKDLKELLFLLQGS